MNNNELRTVRGRVLVLYMMLVEFLIPTSMFSFSSAEILSLVFFLGCGIFLKYYSKCHQHLINNFYYIFIICTDIVFH